MSLNRRIASFHWSFYEVLLMSTLISCDLLQMEKKGNIKTKKGNLICIYIYIAQSGGSSMEQLVLSLNMKILLRCTMITSLATSEPGEEHQLQSESRAAEGRWDKLALETGIIP